MENNLSGFASNGEKNEKILSALGLARKAGRIVIGAELTLESIRGAKCKMAFLASDISESSEKKLCDALSFRDIPYIKLGADKRTLAMRLGKEGYAVSCGLCDESFTNLVYKTLGLSEK